MHFLTLFISKRVFMCSHVEVKWKGGIPPYSLQVQEGMQLSQSPRPLCLELVLTRFLQPLSPETHSRVSRAPLMIGQSAKRTVRVIYS
jgi:hypothetical protein